MEESLYEGELIRLRAYQKDDVPKALEFVNDPKVKLFLTTGIPFLYRLEDEEKWYEGLGKDPTQSLSFAIEDKETGQYIGGCGYNKIDWKNSFAVVGIFVAPSHHGRGYGTDAMNVLVNFIFSEMNLNKIVLYVFGFNERAIKSYKKCGFQVEGSLREQVFRDGQFHDELVMGLLRSEWRKQI